MFGRCFAWERMQTTWFLSRYWVYRHCPDRGGIFFWLCENACLIGWRKQRITASTVVHTCGWLGSLWLGDYCFYARGNVSAVEWNPHHLISSYRHAPRRRKYRWASLGTWSNGCGWIWLFAEDSTVGCFHPIPYLSNASKRSTCDASSVKVSRPLRPNCKWSATYKSRGMVKSLNTSSLIRTNLPCKLLKRYCEC